MQRGCPKPHNWYTAELMFIGFQSIIHSFTTFTYLIFFSLFLAMLQGLWGLSSLTKDQTCASLHWKHGVNHWTTSEVPQCLCFMTHTL